jgi:flagellar FliL protein
MEHVRRGSGAGLVYREDSSGVNSQLQLDRFREFSARIFSLGGAAFDRPGDLKKSETAMSKPTKPAVASDKAPGRGRGRLLLFAGLPVLLLGGGAAAVFLVPGLSSHIPGLGHAAPPPPAAPVVARPAFLDLPDMAVTLPNGGHPRQMRIRISLELGKNGPVPPPPDILSPRVYDALLTYLRTLGDGEIDGAIAIDRIRADLYRRLTLLLGAGVVRDVLVTSLVVG